MKVNFNEKPTGTYLFKLKVGSTFLAKRSNSKEIALYMVLDKNSGVFLSRYRQNIMAVNLTTGQVRAFMRDFIVEPVETEVNLIN